MVIEALNINSTVGFEYNVNIVSSDTAVSTSEGRGYTVVFFVVGHFIFYTCSVYGTFGVLGHKPTDISRWELVRGTSSCCIN
jgi:hypothetical protein